MFAVTLFFHGDLAIFLPREFRTASSLQRTLNEKAAVKDVIEACGVPHVEVDLISVTTADGGACEAVDFSWPVASPVEIEVYPVPAPPNAMPQAPRLQERFCDRFIADGHLGKLARHLRLLGLDTAYERDADDRRLLDVMSQQNRALLTRDRRLLMHSVVHTGYCLRSSDAEEQAREILRRFDLLRHPQQLKTWSRCLRCNGLLARVEKSDVMVPLADEPLTLRYYEEFRRCRDCGRIYWAGTHSERLNALLSRLMRGM